jgi:hypothetical protein
MKIHLVRSFVGLAVVCSVLCFGRSLVAGPSPAAGLLVQAYTTLGQADHDYKGHRVAAMKQIEAAAKLLGVNVRGDGKGHEKQGVSDAQLTKKLVRDLGQASLEVGARLGEGKGSAHS